MKTLLIALVLLTGQTPPAAAPAVSDDYVVGVGDVISLRVFGEEDATRPELLIESDGTVEVPHLGRISVVGKTARQIQDFIEAQFVKNKVYTNPSVSVTIKEFKSQTVYVMGQVKRPGGVPLTGNLTVVDALVKAEWFGPDAGSEVHIIRRRAGEVDNGPLQDRAPDVILSRQDIEEGREAAKTRVSGGDTIRVPKADVFFVTGNVKNPNTYVLRPGLTVWQAVSAVAGGLTERAAKGRIHVIRTVKGKETKVEVKNLNTFIVQPNDTIVVPNRRW